MVLRGDHDYDSLGELNRSVRRRGLEELGEMAFGFPGRPARLSDVPSGRHSICASPLPFDMKSPELYGESFLQHQDDLPVKCRSLELEPGDPERSISFEFEPPALPQED